LAADLCLDAGDIETAHAWLRAHDTWLKWSGTVLGVAAGDAGWARLHLAAGDDAAAAARANAALRRASEPDQPGVRLEAHRLLGELAFKSGRVDEAIAESTRAVELAQACELPYERALGQLLLSEAWMATGRNSDANAVLTEAMTTLTFLDARPAVQRAESLATRAGIQPATLTRNSDLTEREREVLRLIVAGRSNQAIADDLFISWTTARTHVSNIFRKLGVSTRAEAVDAAHRRGLTGSSETRATDR
jgi:ATP/maltotriose-dependent transcriptional regulator MalT